MIEGLDRTDNNNFIHQTQRLDWYLSKEISANYTIANDDKYKFISCKAAATVTLPLTTSNLDRVIEIMITTAGAPPVIHFAKQGADTLLNFNTTLNANYQGVRLKALSGTWVLTDYLP